LVMNDSSPHVTASGIPMIARATLSSTATISPKIVVTTRYDRVPRAKPRAPPRSAVGRQRDRLEPTAHTFASTKRNSSSASRNTRFDNRPATPASIPG
jgi:hypothetical protein